MALDWLFSDGDAEELDEKHLAEQRRQAHLDGMRYELLGVERRLELARKEQADAEERRAANPTEVTAVLDATRASVRVKQLTERCEHIRAAIKEA